MNHVLNIFVKKNKRNTLSKPNMDTQSDVLEKVTPFKNGILFVSMLDFWGVNEVITAARSLDTAGLFFLV